MILQPTRVIQRKGIELSIELVYRLNLPSTYRFITHRADDERLSYWNWLQREAASMKVPLVLIDHLIAAERSGGDINDTPCGMPIPMPIW